MRTRTAMTVAGSVASALLLGGIAYAAVQSVDDRPGPQVVVPSSSPSDRHHARHGSDDPYTHDANDDSRDRQGGGHGSDDGVTGDDPATHDVNDDHGGDDGGSGHGGHGGDD